MTVLLNDLEYPVPRLPGTDQALPFAVGRLDGPQNGLRRPVPSLIPHLNGPAAGVPGDIIVFYKADADHEGSPAWSSQVYRFDPATGAMRRIV